MTGPSNRRTGIDMTDVPPSHCRTILAAGSAAAAALLRSVLPAA